MKMAMILSGCGVYDGSEIHESVMLLLACAEQGISVEGFGPDSQQAHVTNHLDQENQDEERHVLKEAARIMRGPVQSLDQYDPAAYDALLFPGGFGAVTTLCTFGQTQSADFDVHPQVQQAIDRTYEHKKPMVFLCISPLIAGRVLGSKGIKLTLGTDETYLNVLKEMGVEAIPKASRDIVWDETHRIGSSPAYMLAETVEDVHIEAQKLIGRIID